MAFDTDQLERYSRQLILPGTGTHGQQRLLNAKVLLVGIGGLGSPAALYLAAAGVGTIGVVDPDSVHQSNLQRQILYTTEDIENDKTTCAEEKLSLLNPDVQVLSYSERLTAANALRILDGYDFVVDGTDNFSGKFLVADACHFAGIPYSHAAVVRFYGQALTVRPGTSTCYRCIFGSPPPRDAVPGCAESGILGAVAGTMGSVQATETIKYLLGHGELLTDVLLKYDALNADFRKLALSPNPECPLCGANPSIRRLEEGKRLGQKSYGQEIENLNLSP